MSRITLITGGARSGKSDYALKGASRCFLNPAFLATAEACDDEMRRRIDRHRQERGERFITHEEPLQIATAVRHLAWEHDGVLIDCLTVWLGNLFHHLGEAETYEPIEQFLQLLSKPPTSLIIVTNEVGMGLVPEHPVSRLFRDLAGKVNRAVADLADDVLFLVSGQPLQIKRNGRIDHPAPEEPLRRPQQQYEQ